MADCDVRIATWSFDRITYRAFAIVFSTVPHSFCRHTKPLPVARHQKQLFFPLTGSPPFWGKLESAMLSKPWWLTGGPISCVQYTELWLVYHLAISRKSHPAVRLVLQSNSHVLSRDKIFWRDKSFCYDKNLVKSWRSVQVILSFWQNRWYLLPCLVHWQRWQCNLLTRLLIACFPCALKKKPGSRHRFTTEFPFGLSNWDRFFWSEPGLLLTNDRRFNAYVKHNWIA